MATMTPRIKVGFGYRPPALVIENRIAEACAVLALKPHAHRSELHKLFAARWLTPSGNPVHYITIDRILIRARAALTKRSRRPKDAWIDDLIAGYEQDASSADPNVRNAARKGLREMLGLDAPRRQEITGAGGAPVTGKDVIIVWPHELAGEKGNNGNGNGSGRENHPAEAASRSS